MKKLTLLTIITLLTIVPVLTYASFNKTLAPGSTGAPVRELQTFLTNQGLYNGPITGSYGNLTKKAVIDFQKKYNIKPFSGSFSNPTKNQANKLADISTVNKLVITDKTTTSVVFDVCKNIEGIQTLAPTGMYSDNGNCLPVTTSTQQQINSSVSTLYATPSDLCPNIAGNQTNMPNGMIMDNFGDCVTAPVITPPVVVDVCPNITGLQTAVPYGMILQNGNCITLIPQFQVTLNTGYNASINYGTTPSQQIPISVNGLQNGTRAVYNITDYPSSQSGAITELKFNVNDGNTNSISSISVGSVTTPVVNGVAYVTGLGIGPLNGGGSNFQALVSYAPLVASGIQSSIVLSYIKATLGNNTITICDSGCTQVMSPISAPTMTLVSSL
jgi:hypothetical protein